MLINVHTEVRIQWIITHFIKEAYMLNNEYNWQIFQIYNFVKQKVAMSL